MKEKCEEASYLTMSDALNSDDESVENKIQSDDSDVELPPQKRKKLEMLDTLDNTCKGKCNCNSNYRNLSLTMLTMQKTLNKVESKLTQIQHSSSES